MNDRAQAILDFWFDDLIVEKRFKKDEKFDQLIREKFGEDVVIKKFEKSKSWLSKKLSSSNDHVDQLANILEEKSVWQKYGL